MGVLSRVPNNPLRTGVGRQGGMPPGSLLLLTLLSFQPTQPLRCYTDLASTKSASVECGMNTGCVKIYKKPRDTDSRGKYIPKHKRGPDVEVFKGCFIVALRGDICFDSKSGAKLTYCWCSQKDLCNSAQTEHLAIPTLFFLIIALSK